MKTMDLNEKKNSQVLENDTQNVCLVTMQLSNQGSLGSKQHGNVQVRSVSHQLQVDIKFLKTYRLKQLTGSITVYSPLNFPSIRKFICLCLNKNCFI